jgi:hypothetical protein
VTVAAKVAAARRRVGAKVLFMPAGRELRGI